MNAVRLFSIAYCLLLALIIATRHRDHLKYLRLTRKWSKPPLVLAHWRVPPLSDTEFTCVGCGLVVCLSLVAIRDCARIALLVSAALYFIYFGQIISLSYVVRKSNLIPQVCVLLAVSTATTDSFTSTPHAWQIREFEWLIAATYLSAGVSKLRKSGIKWANGLQLQAILLMAYLKYGQRAALKMAANKTACQLLSCAVLCHQLTFWLAVWSPRTALLYAIVGLIFHVSTLKLLKIDYLTYQGPAYLVFFAAPCAQLYMTYGVR